MAIVAVPGGTGNVGRAIVDAIVATGKHQVKILSRKVPTLPNMSVSDQQWEKLTINQANASLEVEIGVPIIPVDFSNVDAIVKVLEEHHIDTVVSAIAMHTMGDDAPNELELIRAADRSRVTKRIISSEWGTDVKEQYVTSPKNNLQIQLHVTDTLSFSQIGLISSTLHKVNAKKELEKTTTLEYTRFHNGYFSDYWAFPKVPSYLSRQPLVYWIDMENNAAAIPGTGDVPAVFTHTTDLAKFVAASLDLPKWEPDYFVYGDRLTWNEFVRLAEEAKGMLPFLPTYLLTYLPTCLTTLLASRY